MNVRLYSFFEIMSWEITWVDMCRGCMEVEGTLIPLFNDGDESSENDLTTKLSELTSVQVNEFFCLF